MFICPKWLEGEGKGVYSEGRVRDGEYAGDAAEADICEEIGVVGVG